MTELKAQLARATGVATPTEEHMLKKVYGNGKTEKAANGVARDEDVPFTKPSKEHVDAQTIADILVGATRFEVHCMICIGPGQILSIGWKGIDM